MDENITEHIAYDRGVNEGFDKGKRFAQEKVIELMDEVIEEYKLLARQEKMGKGLLPKAQLNAVAFMKSWVLSGGQEDFEGNRVCLPW